MIRSSEYENNVHTSFSTFPLHHFPLVTQLLESIRHQGPSPWSGLYLNKNMRAALACQYDHQPLSRAHIYIYIYWVAGKSAYLISDSSLKSMTLLNLLSLALGCKIQVLEGIQVFEATRRCHIVRSR